MLNKREIPLPHFARQLWPKERQLKWWVKYYINRNFHEWEPVDIEGEKIVCVRRGSL